MHRHSTLARWIGAVFLLQGVLGPIAARTTTPVPAQEVRS